MQTLEGHRKPGVPDDQISACLVFIHDNETLARENTDRLFNQCNFNKVMIQQHGSRTIRILGSDHASRIDPNELFHPDIYTRCKSIESLENCWAEMGVLAPTRSQSWSQNKLSLGIQYFHTVRQYTRHFTIPVLGIHNNDLLDTYPNRTLPNFYNELYSDETRRRSRRRHRLSHDLIEALGRIRGNIFCRTATRRFTVRNYFDNTRDLRVFTLDQLLEWAGGRNSTIGRLMNLSGKTNIFRWCNAPEIGLCKIGDPEMPDHVVWVTNISDFTRLAAYDINIALQTERTGRSETDFSSLFIQVQRDQERTENEPPVRFINLETPLRRLWRRNEGYDQFEEWEECYCSMNFIYSVLSILRLDASCTDSDPCRENSES